MIKFLLMRWLYFGGLWLWAMMGLVNIPPFLWPNPAMANQALDDITKQILKDAFIQLRFTALSLENDDETGQALEGLVRAMLARGEIDAALMEVSFIDDPIWHSRALISVSDHFARSANLAQALTYLDKAFVKVNEIENKKIHASIVKILVIKYTELGAFDKAVTVANALPKLSDRIEALQKSADTILAHDKSDATVKEAAQKLLRETAIKIKEIKATDQRIARLIINIGRSQIQVGDLAEGKKTLDFALDWIVRGQNQGKNQALSFLAVALTESDSHKKAMAVLRRLPEGPEQVMALSSIARALSGRKEFDAAQTLFTLASEGIERIKNTSTQDALYAHLLREQTRIGLLADAFVTAGAIQDPVKQSAALLAMADILIKSNKISEAEVLKNYIPYIGMRSRIFAAMALRENLENKGDNTSEILLEGLQSTGYPILSRYLPKAIRDNLTIQVKFGERIADNAIFKRVEELAHMIEDPLERVNALTFIAVAQAERDLIQDAKNTMTSAWRLGWANKNLAGYDKVLANIVTGLIAIGDPLSAFDSAVRIPEPQEDLKNQRAPDGSFRAPKFFALTKVAAASARDREMDMAIRATRLISNPPARAAALAAVAVAMVSPDIDLREIVGEGPGWDEGKIDLGLSRDFQALAYNMVELDNTDFRAGFSESDSLLGSSLASDIAF